MDLKEKKLSSELIYKGKIIDVYKDKVVCPNGHESVREYVSHCRASCVMALTDDGKFLVEKQYRYPYDEVIFEFPAGKCDKGEDPLITAKRELEEETGYQADQWYYLGRIHNAIGYSDEHLEFFLAKGLKAGDRHLDEGECLEVYRLPFKEVKEMTLNGDITDVKTIIGVFWLEKYLKGEMAVQAC